MLTSQSLRTIVRAMIDISNLKKHAEDLLHRAGDGASQEKAAGLVETIEKIEGERANTIRVLEETKEISLRRHEASRSHWKEILGIVTPFLSTIILAGSLVLQGFTFTKLEQDKNNELNRQQQDKTNELRHQEELAEKARWTEALKVLSESEKRSPAAALLRSFTASPYKELARKEAITLLVGRENNASAFQELFNSVFLPADWDSLPDILQLNKELFEQQNPFLLKQWDFSTKTADPRKLQGTEKRSLDRLEAELSVIRSAIAPLLTSRRPANVELNLKSVDLSECDLSNADLSGADIEAAGLSNVLLDNANLDNIKSFQTSGFVDSPWWHAKRISPDLLNYLKNNFRFEEQRKEFYKKSKLPLSEQDYEDSIKRLDQQGPR